MTEKIKKFLTKNCFLDTDIKYIVRENSKTFIHLSDGRTIETYIPVKDFTEAFTAGLFLNISKGILVSKDYLENISGDIYTMKDGTIFKGRKNHLKEHRINSVNLSNYQNTSSQLGSSKLLDRLSVLDNMPVAYCIFEVVFTKEGKGKNFVLRYCNNELNRLENLEVKSYINKDLPEVFKKNATELFALCTEVALHGGTKDYSITRKSGKQLMHIKLYQPFLGFCACVAYIEDI